MQESALYSIIEKLRYQYKNKEMHGFQQLPIKGEN